MIAPILRAGAALVEIPHPELLPPVRPPLTISLAETATVSPLLLVTSPLCVDEMQSVSKYYGE
jgi:hypothetical protein